MASSFIRDGYLWVMVKYFVISGEIIHFNMKTKHLFTIRSIYNDKSQISLEMCTYFSNHRISFRDSDIIWKKEIDNVLLVKTKEKTYICIHL